MPAKPTTRVRKTPTISVPIVCEDRAQRARWKAMAAVLDRSLSDIARQYLDALTLQVLGDVQIDDSLTDQQMAEQIWASVQDATQRQKGGR